MIKAAKVRYGNLWVRLLCLAATAGMVGLSSWDDLHA
jgi:hypothetical protein